MQPKYCEIGETAQIPKGIGERARSGEVFVIRRCLQRLNIFDDVVATSLGSLERVAGADVASKVKSNGFDAIHRFISLDQIEAVADGIYERATQRAPKWVAKIAPDILDVKSPYYFERTPNIRFHVPYDVMAADAVVMERFSKKAGGGKLAPHPNHRDSWVGCPDNLINVWAAVGPVPEGCGLTIFPGAFKRDISRVGASIAVDEHPGSPLNFNLEPGDAVVFHGEQLHSSVLNRTSVTRHAISFRIVNEKPNFPNTHYHRYVHSSLAGGPLDALAGIPANIARSYMETRLGSVAKTLGLRKKETPRSNTNQMQSDKEPVGGTHRLKLSSLEENSLQPLGDKICIARIGNDKLVAFDRKCPHGGGDLALGTIINGEITCPWHNLRFDPDTGASACRTVKNLRVYDTVIEGDEVTVSLEQTT